MASRKGTIKRKTRNPSWFKSGFMVGDTLLDAHIPMQVHIRYGGTDIQLPQLPPSFEVQGQAGNQSVTVHTIGEVTLIGKPQLETIDISSIFPGQPRQHSTKTKTWEEENFKDPYSYVKTLEGWKSKGCVVTLIITKTNIAMNCTIEAFTYGESSENAPGDVNYTISLKRYKDHPMPTSGPGYTARVSGRTSNAKIKPGSTYTVKKGDTLAKISQRAWGKTKYKKKLYKKNKKAIEKAWKKYRKKENKAIKKWNKAHPKNKKKLLPKTTSKGKRLAPGTKIVIKK